MREFKQLVQDVLDNGVLYNNGKGNCLGVIGSQVKYDISETLPVVTSKKTNIPWAVAEMAMFIKGISHLDFLKKYGAEKIWAGQSLSEDFLASVRPAWLYRGPGNSDCAVLCAHAGIHHEYGSGHHGQVRCHTVGSWRSRQ